MTEIPMDRMRTGDCATVGTIYHFPLKNRLLDIGMNCGTTKPIKMAMTATIITDKMIGYIRLLPTCWLTLCSRS